MPLTPRYQFMVLPPEASIADLAKHASDRYQFDSMFYSVVNHRHDGATIASPDAPDSGHVDTTLVPAGGFLPVDLDVFYRWSIVSAAGVESPASTPVTIHTPGPLDTPGPPLGVGIHTTGGSCYPGTWAYRVTAWRGTFGADTVGSPQVVANLEISNGDEQQIVLILPELPAGADGFNIYRMKPGSTNMQYLTSILDGEWEMILGYPGFTDTGAESEIPERSLSHRDQSSLPARVTLSVGSVPTGESVRLYRSYNTGEWANTWIADLNVADGLTHEDLGGTPQVGSPVPAGSSFNNPPQVNINTETTGVLAAERVQGTLHAMSWHTEGSLTIGPLDEQIMPFTAARIVGATLTSSTATTPGATDVLVDIEQYNGSSWVAVIEDITLEVADVMAHANVATPVELARGARLRARITQVDSADDPDGLHVALALVVKHDLDTFDWA